MIRWFLNLAFRKNGYSQKQTYWSYHPTHQILSHGVHKSGCHVDHAANCLRWHLIYAGSQYGTCFMSPFWCLEFWGGFWILQKSVQLDSVIREVNELEFTPTAWTRMALSGAHHGNLLFIPWRNWGNFPIRMHLSLLALLRTNRATKIHIIF
jgi:hypothetical protein